MGTVGVPDEIWLWQAIAIAATVIIIIIIIIIIKPGIKIKHLEVSDLSYSLDD
jgi:hypothetical protein